MEKDIKDLEELGMPKELERVKVRVLYKNNGCSGEYICGIYLNNSLRLSVRLPPDGYSIDGIFVDGDDEPAVGVSIRRKMLKERNVFVGGSKNHVLYGRVLKHARQTPEKLRAVVCDFVDAVAETVPDVNKLIHDYLTNGLCEDLKQYLRKR
jgi:hypothetical protein